MLAPVVAVLVARAAGWESGPLAIAVALTPWVVVAVLVPVLVGVVARAWSLVVAGVAVAVWGAATQAPVFVAEGAPVDATPVLTVASVNATFGRVDPDEVVALVRDAGVDVLAVQELTPGAAAALADAGLEQVLPHAVTAPEEGFAGTGVWTSLPVEASGEVVDTTANTLMVHLGGVDNGLTVYAVHPAAPAPLDHALWAKDLAIVAAALEAQTGPAVAVGDFNATRDHAVIRGLEGAGFVDAADAAGDGWGFTFPQGRGVGPVVAIDHVLERDTGWTATGATTVPLSGADHRALIVDYVR